MNTAKESLVLPKQFSFTAAARSKVRELSQVSSLRACLPLVLDWMCIGGVVAVSAAVHSPIVYLMSILIIATRQHALLVIVHEGAHFRLNQRRVLNDFIANWGAAYPIFFCANAYRANHHAHHQFLNSEADPDWARKIHLSEWQFPKSRKDVCRTFAKVAVTSWYKMVILFWMISGLGRKSTWTDGAKRKIIFAKFLFYLIAAGALTLVGGWSNFFFYWVIPYLTILPVIERIRSISEHFALGYQHDLNATRNVLCGSIEAFLFGPHNICYHLDHHLFPTVPQYRLPELHAYLSAFSEYAEHAHNNDSYFLGQKSVLSDVTIAN